MNVPGNLHYTKDHEWLRVEGNEGFVGITDFAQGQLGDVVYVEVETVGETISKGDSFGTIEAVKTVSDMFMPVTGEIIELNPAIETAPETLNKDPYGDGWIIKIKIVNPDEVKDLLNPDQYSAQINH
jgi:glycine cleavage system H protein